MSDIDTKIKEAKEASISDPYVYRQNSVNVYVHGALLQAKALIPSIKKNKKVEFGKTKYSYPDLPEILSIVSPVLAKHEILYTTQTVVFDQPYIHDNVVYFGKLITKLIHVPTGEFMSSEDPLTVRIKSVSLDYSSSKEKVSENNIMQGYGSAKTFAQRYGLLTILGLAPEMDDDAYGSAPDVNFSTTIEAEPAPKVTKVTPPPAPKVTKVTPPPALKLASSNHPVFTLWEMKKEEAVRVDPERAKRIQTSIDSGGFLSNPQYAKMEEWIKGL
jgi:hypothetical protein